jgi:serine/threonine protein kinase
MLSSNSSSSVREMRIIQAIQKLSHRNLLRIHNVWSIPEYIVCSMELADGSLLDMLDLYQSDYRSPLAPVLVINYLSQAAAALDFLNARRHSFEGRTVGFQHCDVKPSNLLLTGEIVKLADFGLCTPTVALQSSYSKAGTLDFAAPEVHRGSLSETSDQYSLAVTYVYLRTGLLPFPATPSNFQREYSYKATSSETNGVSSRRHSTLSRAIAGRVAPTLWPTSKAQSLGLSQPQRTALAITG